jgi:hypothetical protein
VSASGLSVSYEARADLPDLLPIIIMVLKPEFYTCIVESGSDDNVFGSGLPAIEEVYGHWKEHS